mmetsp:Transcript_28092/g.81004  ORF Transcript_28092/g.81004 Transcript_28092/m.81004 type:complete len:318 (+) Transcript_28092:177-1130(+)
MATTESPASLGDFFAKKNKKKIKGSNLNVASATSKPEVKKAKSKDAEEEGWEEEQVVAPTMKVDIAGKLLREEDKKEEDDSVAPAWGSLKSSKNEARDLNDKRFPTLAKSVRVSSNINIDDGSDAKVNITTSKNVFAALENEEDDDQPTKRPKEIKPAMVQKKKGESEKVAIQREVDKYSHKKGAAKKDDSDGEEGEDDDEDDEDQAEGEEGEAKKEPEPAEPKRRDRKAEKKAEAAEKEEPERQEEKVVEEDLAMKADLAAVKAKYQKRKKPFPAKPLPQSELAEEKENKPRVQPKKKKGFFEEEDDKPKLQVWED